MAYTVTLIPGDGVGPELSEATRRVLEATGVAFDWEVQEAGADVMDRYGTPLPEHVLVAARQQPDPEEEHDEPARVDPDADSHHGDEMYGAAAAHQSMLKGSVLWLTK